MFSALEILRDPKGRSRTSISIWNVSLEFTAEAVQKLQQAADFAAL